MYEASSSQESDDGGFVPNAKEAADLVKQFAEVTGTDTVRYAQTNWSSHYCIPGADIFIFVNL